MRWSLIVSALLLSSVASADDWHLFRAKTVFAFAVVQEEGDKPVVPADGKCKYAQTALHSNDEATPWRTAPASHHRSGSSSATSALHSS